MSQTIKRLAVFTSGGDAPGMNAAIRAVVRTATYHDLHIYGIMRGYSGMIDGEINRLETQDVANIIHRGGTMLKTARSEAFRTRDGRKQAYESLLAHDIDACIAIGGNGTFTGAKIFMEEYDLPFVGVPGTIDNDLYGTDYTIGFDTAINTAIDAVDKIRDTADSHNRLFFIEVMGRDSGFIALNTGLGSGAGSILLPEVVSDMERLIALLKKSARRKKLFSLVIVAEGDENGGATGVAEIVKERFNKFEVKVTIIGHLQRGGSPTCQDRILASRMGYEAVCAIIGGQKNIMVGLQNNSINLVSFDDAINKQKPLNEDLLKLAEVLLDQYLYGHFTK